MTLLKQNEVEPHVVTISLESGPSLLEKFVSANVEVRSLGLTRLASVLHGRAALKGTVRRLQVDVMHTQGIRADAIAATERTLTRVATIRNYPYHDYPMKYGAVTGKIMARAHIEALNRLDCVVACSETLQALVSAHGIKSEVVHNGVDTDVFCRKGAVVRESVRRRLGIPRTSFAVGMVGSLIARKDPLTVIRAFRRSGLAQRGGFLVVVGDGRMMEECRRAAGSCRQVVFVGQIANVAEVLCALDLLVSASHSEGMPNSVLEALASGLPVLLSKIPQHEEILRRGPKAGGLFSLSSVGELSEQLHRSEWARSPRSQQRARELAQEHFSASRMVQSYLNLFLRLARQSCPSTRKARAVEK